MHTLGINQVVALRGGYDQLGMFRSIDLDLQIVILMFTRVRRVFENHGDRVSTAVVLARRQI